MKYLYMLLFAIAGVAMTTGCSDKDDSLALNGMCMVEALTIDKYDAAIDKEAQTLTLYVSEGTAVDDMQVTNLKISEGATTTLTVGTHLNLSTPRAFRVQSGNVMMEWTIIVKTMAAQIEKVLINGRKGVLDESTNTITVYLPQGTDVTTLMPTITVSEGATVTGSDVITDFSMPHMYVVTNNGIARTYTVQVELFNRPDALYIGGAETQEDLAPEEGAACEWAIENLPKTLYISLNQIAEGYDLTGVKFIYWHAHKDGGVDGHDRFLDYVAPFVGIDPGVGDLEYQLQTKLFDKLKTCYEDGCAFFLTRYAGNLASFIGATGTDTWTTPNNCWGQYENEAEECGGPWTFMIWGGQESHPLYANLIGGDKSNEVYCTDKGYHITNSTSQYHIGSDWGGYDDHNAWVARTGGVILGVGGDGAIVAWEYPAKDGKGGILCIGSGCFDWWAYKTEKGYKEYFHKNISKMAQNAYDYLTK